MLLEEPETGEPPSCLLLSHSMFNPLQNFRVSIPSVPCLSLLTHCHGTSSGLITCRHDDINLLLPSLSSWNPHLCYCYWATHLHFSQSTAHMRANQKVRFHLADGIISISLTSWNPHQTRSVLVWCLKAQCFQEILQQDPQRPPPHSSPFSTQPQQ